MQRIDVLIALIWLVACGSRPEVPDLVRTSEPGYTGVARCAACHTNTHTAWKRSLHSIAMAVPSDSTVVGNFDGAVHTYGGVTSRMVEKEGDFYMETPGADGRAQPFRVDYVIGKRQHQAYLTGFSDGRYQVLPLYHNGPTSTWVDAQEGGVVEKSRPLTPSDFYYWTNAGRTWNFHCFDCHASRVEKHYDLEKNIYRTTVGSLSIDCEACHGPSEKHDRTRGKPGEPMHLVDLARLDKEQAVEMCAQCHAAKEVIGSGYVPGANFYDYAHLILPDDETVFYPDGQPRVYLYPAALHVMSACFIYDDLRCTTCHDAHGSTREVDLVADREGVDLCASCHGDLAKNPVAHGHHKPGSAGNQCVSCHMPYHQVTGEHLTDHRIASPAPKNTVVNGVPNACNQSGCHADQSAQWAAQWAEAWYGPYQDGVVKRTSAVSQAQQGDRAAVPVLRAMLGDDSAVWRATAASLLGRLGDAGGVSLLVQAVKDAHPMVRLKTVRALGQLGDVRAWPVLRAALSDSARSVRIQVPFALLWLGDVPGDVRASEAFERALSEDREAVYGVRSDDSGYHMSLGWISERLGLFADAERAYQTAIRLEGRDAETEAVLVRLKETQAQVQKLQAVLEPGKTALDRARLGALLLRHRRYREAVTAFEDAGRDGESALLLTAMGHARLGSGDRAGAQAAYVQALALSPGFRPAVRGLATLVFSSVDELPAPVAKATADALLDRAVKAVHAGDLNGAAAAFARILADEADGHVEIGLGRLGIQKVNARADSASERGRIAYSEGDLNGALAHYAEAAALDPERLNVREMQALILAERSELAAAEGHVFEALIADPGDADALTVLGLIYQERGAFDDALALYRQALELDADMPSAVLFMGQAYMLQGNRDSARAVLHRAIRQWPDNAMARDMLYQVGGPEM